MPTALLQHAIQPPLLTILNSSSSPALSLLFHSHVDKDLVDDSFICEVQDDDPPNPKNGDMIPKKPTRGSSIAQRVVHVQSPTIKTTYIQAGSAEEPLGIKSCWMGLQIKRLGKRHFAFEIGIVDSKGLEGRVRFSTFQNYPRLHLSSTPPLLHIPLTLPDSSSPSVLTSWLDISIHIPTLLPLFQNHALLPSPPSSETDDPDGQTHVRASRRTNAIASNRNANAGATQAPSGTYGSTTYVKVYANCRVKRIWFADEGGMVSKMGGSVRDEWGLYAGPSSPALGTRPDEEQ